MLSIDWDLKIVQDLFFFVDFGIQEFNLLVRDFLPPLFQELLFGINKQDTSVIIVITLTFLNLRALLLLTSAGLVFLWVPFEWSDLLRDFRVDVDQCDLKAVHLFLWKWLVWIWTYHCLDLVVLHSFEQCHILDVEHFDSFNLAKRNYHPWFLGTAHVTDLVLVDKKGTSVEDQEPFEHHFVVVHELVDFTLVNDCLWFPTWISLGFESKFFDLFFGQLVLRGIVWYAGQQVFKLEFESLLVVDLRLLETHFAELSWLALAWLVLIVIAW